MEMDTGIAVTECVTLAHPGKYLTFVLGAEIFGIQIQKIQEIIGMMQVTHVPRTPSYVRGVINLRGKVIPIADLRLRFGMDERPDTERTCIIVLDIGAGANRAIAGIIVDEVSEVLFIDGTQIEPPPAFGSDVETDFILGMGKVGEKVVMLLGVDSVLSVGEIAAIEKE
jgi:purine-binding chemotaxis protein CheW